MNRQTKTKRELIRVGKHLSEIVSIRDATGNLLHKVVKPVMVEVYPRDLVQQVVGAALLSIPIAFTDEALALGLELSWLNVLLLGIVSMSFMGVFVYHNFYRHHFSQHKLEFAKRILTTYIISLGVALLILLLINKAPFGSDWVVTIKRMVILSFPASMSAAVADMIK